MKDRILSLLSYLTLLTVVLALVLLVGPGDTARAGQQAAQPERDGALGPLSQGRGRPAHGPKYKPDELLVRFRPGVATAHVEAAHAGVGARVLRAYSSVKGLYHVRIPPGMAVEDAIQRYKRNREVLYAEPNYIVHIDNTPNDPSFPDLWGLNNTGQGGGTVDADIDAPEAWDLTTGSSSVVIADIDTGIDYNHEDLAANVWQNPGDCSINGIDMEPRQPQVAAARREDRRAVARLRESQPDVDLVGLTPNGFELGMPQLQSEPRPLLAGYSP